MHTAHQFVVFHAQSLRAVGQRAQPFLHAPAIQIARVETRARFVQRVFLFVQRGNVLFQGSGTHRFALGQRV